ncbi:exodeoxyribonuclease III [Gordonia sinesedis]
MSTSITTVNVNGIRAAVRQRSKTNLGFLDWLRTTDSTAVLLQEIRADEDQAREALGPALADGWNLSMVESVVKGHAGVGVLSRVAPSAVRIGFGSAEFDATGRYVEADLPTDVGPMTVASLYLPKGAAEPAGAATADRDARQRAKFDEKRRFLTEFGGYLERLRRRRRHVVIGGDWNIAPAEADIKNWKGNLRSPGFLPHERDWVAGLLDSGWTDVARALAPEADGPYTWWSWRGKAFDNDSGWRLDYQLANRSLAARAVESVVDRAAAYDLRWSDHAPVTVIYA